MRTYLDPIWKSPPPPVVVGVVATPAVAGVVAPFVAGASSSGVVSRFSQREGPCFQNVYTKGLGRVSTVSSSRKKGSLCTRVESVRW